MRLAFFVSFFLSFFVWNNAGFAFSYFAPSSCDQKFTTEFEALIEELKQATLALKKVQETVPNGSRSKLNTYEKSLLLQAENSHRDLVAMAARFRDKHRKVVCKIPASTAKKLEQLDEMINAKAVSERMIAYASRIADVIKARQEI